MEISSYRCGVVYILCQVHTQPSTVQISTDPPLLTYEYSRPCLMYIFYAMQGISQFVIYSEPRGGAMRERWERNQEEQRGSSRGESDRNKTTGAGVARCERGCGSEMKNDATKPGDAQRALSGVNRT